MNKRVKRLFDTFEPQHYDLSLELDAKHGRFSGRVTIHGQKKLRPSHRLTFHQKGLKVTAASIIKQDKRGDQAVEVDRINHHRSLQEVRLHTKESLTSGTYRVELAFKGTITPSMLGIYQSRFSKDGKEKTIFATQFESHHAREAFPCIDEPEAKATFALALTAPKDMVALSNMPAVSTSQTNRRLATTRFETTPKMSTYLLAFVAGDLQAVEKTTKHGVVVRSWASTAQSKDYLSYSVDEAVKVLEFFTDFFGTPYPLPKLDQVALPDFDAGAMENWGLVTYREIALLADPKNRSVSTEQYVSLVVAHELSHQWFGNLVTMKWWDDLWLNESFASLMEHIALDALHPDWHQWETYTASDVVSTSSRDIYSDIQPVGVEVTDPDLLHTLFDPGIVYAKGGRLLKMLREYIGEDAFKEGLKQYFKHHAYGNATRDDLWKAFSEASGRDIRGLMNPWLTQAGMPLVRATQHGKELALNQERFVLDERHDNPIWPIPLLSSIEADPPLLHTREGSVQLKSPEFTVLNQRASGHYIVHYTSPEHRAFLVEQLQRRLLPAETRINILNDMFMLARNGDSSIVDALELCAHLNEEPRDSVWALVMRILGAANQLTEGDKTAEQHLKRLKCELAGGWYRALGWHKKPAEDTNTQQLRHTAVSLMIAGEDADAVHQALTFYQTAKRLEDIDAELRNTILGVAVRETPNRQAVNRLLTAYPRVAADVQLDITSALASNKDPDTARRILEAALGKDGFVRTQDIMRWLALFLRNYYVRDVSWDFMLTNWSRIEAAQEDSKSYDFLPLYAANVISTQEWKQKYHDFFEPKKRNKSLLRNILVGYSDIDARIAWRKRDESKITTWLSTRPGNPAKTG